MYNEKYCALLLENSNFHHNVRRGIASYSSPEWKRLQKELLTLELELSAKQIIEHAEYLFPKVGDPKE